MRALSLCTGVWEWYGPQFIDKTNIVLIKTLSHDDTHTEWLFYFAKTEVLKKKRLRDKGKKRRKLNIFFDLPNVKGTFPNRLLF